jgi:O-methyltransferase
MVRLIRSLARKTGLKRAVRYPHDFTADEIELVTAVSPFTMTSAERIVSLANAVRYITRGNVPGAIVECGVWRGGSMMTVARTLLTLGVRDRELHLYDTFEGMSAPTEHDRKWDGAVASDKFRLVATSDGSDWCRVSIEDVTANMLSTGYPSERIHLVKGMVERTIPHAGMPEQIAILRLDTDFYESTRHELEHLYPRLVSGGVLIIDDYGEWEGARRAVDEYLERPGVSLLLNRIDTTGRIAVKP